MRQGRREGQGDGDRVKSGWVGRLVGKYRGGRWGGGVCRESRQSKVSPPSNTGF